MTYFRKSAVAMISVSGALLIGSAVAAHPGSASHVKILSAPIGGERNNHWYDYRSDLEEAEIELRKDLRRAKTAQDRREAHAEYNRELYDARKDYTQEMVEAGYLRRGQVDVLD